MIGALVQTIGKRLVPAHARHDQLVLLSKCHNILEVIPTPPKLNSGVANLGRHLKQLIKLHIFRLEEWITD